LSRVGIIANPASGQDIRRVVSDAIIVNNHQKVNIVRRLLAALTFCRVDEIEIMPDPFGIGERALHEFHPELDHRSRISIVDMPFDGTQDDSLRAAEYFYGKRAACIIVLGGDGTCRVVSKACGDVPLLPISTGTNNVLPFFIEGTVAGLAAGTIAQHPGLERREFADRHKRLTIDVNGSPVDQALVDVALIRSALVGARAVWEANSIHQVLVTLAQPTSIGLSSVVGLIQPIDSHAPIGAAVTLGTPGKKIRVPIAPGTFARLEIQEMKQLEPGIPYPLSDERPAVLALDGEREIVLRPDDRVQVTLDLKGPWIVDVERVMRLAVSEHAFEG
jgi:predicted polyphosphate/ATP-dependent NAD kinase